MADNYVLVDTDVFIWLTRGKSASAAPYVPHVEGKRMVLSFATVAELWLGAELRGYGDRAQRKLEADIGAAVVVPPTEDLTREWARVRSEARTAGHPLGQKAQAHDAWVAATGRLHSLPLLTANVRHFDGLPGLALVETHDRSEEEPPGS